MYQTTELKKGVKLELEDKVYVIVKSDHINPGKGSAFVKVRMKNLETGQVLERTFKSGVSTGAEEPDLQEREVGYMYADSDNYYFMDQNDYETIHVPAESVGDAKNFLQEGIKLFVSFYKGKAIAIDLPNFVELKVAETDPGLKGDTATGGMKKAIMETGLQVNVPLFIEVDELLRIDTREGGQYVERVKS